MSHPLDLFEFPASDWNGKIMLSSSSFLPLKCAYTINYSSACDRYPEDVSDVILCTCHKYCQRHCRVERTAENTYKPARSWPYLLQPYVNVAVCDPWSEKVTTDCVRKLSTCDANGLGALHRLLMHAEDNAALLRNFLEIGVDPEARYVVYKGATKLHIKQTPDVKKVAGGSAIHFAAHFGRGECLKTLIEVGVNLDAQTTDGASATDLCQSEELKDILAQAKAQGARKSFAQLANEGKFYAMRHRIRAGRMAIDDLKSSFEGRTAFQWCLAIMFGKHAVEDGQPNDKLVASQLLLEMDYRFGQEGRLHGMPPQFTFKEDDSVVGESTLAAAVADLDDLRKKQDLILELVCGLNGLKSEAASGEKK